MEKTREELIKEYEELQEQIRLLTIKKQEVFEQISDACNKIDIVAVTKKYEGKYFHKRELNGEEEYYVYVYKTEIKGDFFKAYVLETYIDGKIYISVCDNFMVIYPGKCDELASFTEITKEEFEKRTKEYVENMLNEYGQ